MIDLSTLLFQIHALRHSHTYLTKATVHKNRP